jgi:hypothetical protein
MSLDCATTRTHKANKASYQNGFEYSAPYSTYNRAEICCIWLSILVLSHWLTCSFRFQARRFLQTLWTDNKLLTTYSLPRRHLGTATLSLESPWSMDVIYHAFLVSAVLVRIHNSKEEDFPCLQYSTHTRPDMILCSSPDR